MYAVIELQTAKDGAMACLVSTHETRAEADSKYHLILSSAAISDVPVHAAVILDEHGLVYGNESYDHGDAS